jgi:hypothetical protein
MRDKFEILIAYLAARSAEPSTWQGVAFILALFGSHYADLPWGQCASIGATLSALIKIFLPDVQLPKE